MIKHCIIIVAMTIFLFGAVCIPGGAIVAVADPVPIREMNLADGTGITNFLVYESMPIAARAWSFIARFPAGRNLYWRYEITRWTWIYAQGMPGIAPLEAFWLMLAQQAAESECNPLARSPRNRNGTRDLGLSQQNSRYMAGRGVMNWRDIEQQCRAQSEFMKYLLQSAARFGSDQMIRAALAGYTAGPQYARRGIVPDVGRTRAHVTRIMRYYKWLSANPLPPTGRVYMVRPGDTLSRIAVQFGVTTRDLARVNGIKNVNLIRAGEGLVIP